MRLLAKELTDAGLQVDYESPQERRSGVEQGIIQGVIYVAGALTGGVISDGVRTAANRAISAFKERLSPQAADHVMIEVDDDD
jgi:hypothetical protein